MILQERMSRSGQPAPDRRGIQPYRPGPIALHSGTVVSLQQKCISQHENTKTEELYEANKRGYFTIQEKEVV